MFHTIVKYSLISTYIINTNNTIPNATVADASELQTWTCKQLNNIYRMRRSQQT